jgi:hypothetical protein
LGYATITHPYHPLYGQCLKIIFTRRINDKDVFSLKTETMGTMTVMRDWTDKADPGFYADVLDKPPILSVTHLISLSELLLTLKNSET